MIKAKDLRAEMRMVRDNFSDEYVIKEVVSSYKNLELEGKRVLDLGANIGAFSVYAAMRNCKSVVGYEPEEENYDILMANIDNEKIGSIHGAVTMSKEPIIEFYLSSGPNAGIHSTIPFRGREVVTVLNHYFPYVLSEYKPQVIKMDIEGGEHSLLQHKLPRYVREIIAEIHFSKKAFRKSWLNIISQFKDWECVRVPKETGSNWHTIGHWRR